MLSHFSNGRARDIRINMRLETARHPSRKWSGTYLGSLVPSVIPQRLKGFFFRVDPLSNVSAGTELQATAESAGASARYHTQEGRHPGETIFSELLSGVA